MTQGAKPLTAEEVQPFNAAAIDAWRYSASDECAFSDGIFRDPSVRLLVRRLIATIDHQAKQLSLTRERVAAIGREAEFHQREDVAAGEVDLARDLGTISVMCAAILDEDFNKEVNG